jgi:hypothetical protein
VSLRARHWLLPLLPAAAFLAFGVVTLRDYGITWDEAESWNAAAANLDMLRGTGAPWAATHVLPGYYFAIDTMRALFVEATAALFPLAGSDDEILAHHAFNLLLASASVALLAALVFQISGRLRMAATAAGALALMPPFVGHAQNNPKDLPALFAFLLASCCVVGLARATNGQSSARAWRWVTAGALALGLALTTRVLCATLIPIWAGFLLWRRREALTQKPWYWVALAVGAGAAAFALWPWLWDSPIAKIASVFDRISVHELVDFQIVYLGELRSWSEMPWHYRPVHLLVALPLVYLALGSLSLAAALQWRGRRDSRLDALALAAVWLGVLAIVDLLAPYRYDGLRHFLPALPAVAIGVAAGGEWLHDALAARVTGIASPFLRAATSNAPVGLCAAIAAGQIASTHPHQSAYMNAVANAIAGRHSEEWIELSYWGEAYRDGGRWIEANTERDAMVYLPIGEKIADYYTRRPRGAWQHFETRFERTQRPQYVMFITRLGFYDEAIRRLERDYEPVYSLEVQNASLLKIYSNQTRRRTPPEPNRG